MKGLDFCELPEFTLYRPVFGESRDLTEEGCGVCKNVIFGVMFATFLVDIKNI
jgi:hypothetical protein